ncbi:hypothetical protein HNE05_09715 [Aquipseudomonas campi]|uniref:Lipoprotein n=1 Tax=Aquipseudomonas campi TaxID=2731681 RepID=A0A6M8FBQ2_9GAMM|nr:hypothetical protein [Pseudomonas campi]QKE63623.1 hypothetical protein HNE05_09715 [Pseudomonas campi]
MKYKSLLVGLFSAAILAGCGESEQSLSEKAGKAVGEGVTGFLSGVGSGIDQSMVVETELGAGASKAGLVKTTAKSNGMADAQKSFSVYLVANEPFKGTLLAKAYDKDGQEIGRAKSEVDLQKDDADYIIFAFSERMDSQLVHKYLVDTVQ